MSIFLTLAYLFFIGSTLGWGLELWYRNVVHKRKKWINPGFCTGPYLPIYGFGLCVLFLLASLEPLSLIEHPGWNKAMLFFFMAVCMTIIEYAAGVFCLKVLKVRLWDYSNCRGNLQGIICPMYSAAWAILGAVYYFLIHPHILNALHWLSENLAFSFFIGMFFGFFIVDVVHSAQLVLKLKQFAEENEIIVKYEALKDHIHNAHLRTASKYHFFSPFRSARPLSEHLKEMYQIIEKQKQEFKEMQKFRN
ncbi:MAG: putative ABC transporter permease [Brotaphodocola sp.]